MNTLHYIAYPLLTITAYLCAIKQFIDESLLLIFIAYFMYLERETLN